MPNVLAGVYVAVPAARPSRHRNSADRLRKNSDRTGVGKFLETTETPTGIPPPSTKKPLKSGDRAGQGEKKSARFCCAPRVCGWFFSLTILWTFPAVMIASLLEAGPGASE